MPITYETFERVALEDGDAQWELVCGQLRQKPPMTAEHSDAISDLADLLRGQLDRERYRVRVNLSRLRTSTGAFFVPDLLVLPNSERLRMRAEHPRQLEIYAAPMPLVVEVWSPSTGEYDLNTKIPEYRRRGDREIWLIHPYERWLRAWRRQADGAYDETLFRGDAVIELAALPGVRITLAQLFA